MNQPDDTPTGPTIRVLICDDDPLVRRALTAYLNIANDITLVDAVPDVPSAQAVLAENHIDVLLLDLRMPEIDGREMAAWVARQPDPPRVLYLTSFDDERLGRDTVNGIAAGVLTKDVHPSALVQGIRSVHSGLTVMASSPVGNLRNRVGKTPTGDPLTPREQEVLTKLCAGRSNAEIARELFVSESTVKNVIAALMTRFGVDNRVTLALHAVDAGLL